MRLQSKHEWRKTPILLYMVSNILYSTLFRRNISSNLEPSFVEDIKMAVGFGGVRCEYVQ